MSGVVRRHDPVPLPDEHPIDQEPDPGPWTLGTVITGLLLGVLLIGLAEVGVPVLNVLVGR